MSQSNHGAPSVPTAAQKCHLIGGNIDTGYKRVTLAELREVLGMQEKPLEFEGIKKDLRRMAEKNLKIEHVGVVQTGAITAILNELKEKRPSLYGSGDQEKKLHCVRGALLAFHGQRRRRAKSAMVKHPVPLLPRQEIQKKVEVIDLTLDSDSEPEEKNDCESEDEVDELETSPGPSLTVAEESEMKPTLAELQSAEQKRHLTSKDIALPLRVPEGTDPVAKFLSSCMPSMAHLLPIFREIGCTSEEHLQAISRWHQDRIYAFLKRNSRASERGNSMTEVEVAILENHFIEYFKK
ncbi:unnamed protein product [Cyclocybe aegerita]|uniref:Uncharacterized protein n=1 Tax=Cyclocybe aegerita TaxID=1973307 RepID=A0A8S0WD17_CYCAE|nr:unnamed protein product [Cyclocybe aegerita]